MADTIAQSAPNSRNLRRAKRKGGRAALNRQPGIFGGSAPARHLGPRSGLWAKTDIGWPPTADRTDAHDPKRTSIDAWLERAEDIA